MHANLFPGLKHSILLPARDFRDLIDAVLPFEIFNTLQYPVYNEVLILIDFLKVGILQIAYIDAVWVVE